MSTNGCKFNEDQLESAYSKTANDWFLASSLYDGIEDGNLQQILKLLKYKGANPNTILPEYGIAPIHLSSGWENAKFGYKTTKLFISYGGDPNIKSYENLTPVHVACLWGRTLVLELLLASGGDPWLTDSDDRNAFGHACDQRQWEVLKLLDAHKNKLSERSSLLSEDHYNLQLDHFKLYDNDSCLEYRTSPRSVKCTSTQTPDSSRKTNSVCSNIIEEFPVRDNNSNVRSPKSEKVVKYKAAECEDNTIDSSFSSYPNKQELRALELVRKHRQGMTFYQYLPDTDYNADDDSSFQDNASLCSGDNSPIGSLNTLVRGSVFADVKSKLKSFYKNKMGGNNSNKDCAWKLSIIQRKKEKEKIKTSKSNFCYKKSKPEIGASSSKCKETSSDITNYLKNKFSTDIVKFKGKHYSNIKNKMGISSSDLLENDCQNLLEDTGKNKNDESDQYDDADNINSKTFHRFEDVIDSYGFTKPDNSLLAEHSSNNVTNNENNSECVEVKSSTRVCKGICDELLNNLDSNNSERDVNNIGFVFDNDNINNKNNSNSLCGDYKREIGFSFNDPLNCGFVAESEQCISELMTDDSSIEPFDPIANNRRSDRQIKPSDQISNFSLSLTEDELFTSRDYVCFQAPTVSDIDSSEENRNSNDKSNTDVYFTCSSTNEELSPKHKYIVNSTTDNSSMVCDSNVNGHSRKFIKTSIVYENDDSIINCSNDMFNNALFRQNDNNVNNSSLESNRSNEIRYTTYNNVGLGGMKINSVTGYQTADGNYSLAICNRNTNSSQPDLLCCRNLTSNGNENLPKNLEHNRTNLVEVEVEVHTPATNNSRRSSAACDLTQDENNETSSSFNRLNRSFTLPNNTAGKHKWAYADLISSDEENDVSVIEQYLYTDEEDGIELVEEHHLPVKYKTNLFIRKGHEVNAGAVNRNYATSSAESETESALSSVDTAYETDELRKELKGLGLDSGPITKGTKKIYLRQLKRTKRRPVCTRPVNTEKNFSIELDRMLNSDKNLFQTWSPHEIEMSQPFECPDPNKRWREGTTKNSFTYLLLDPRITQDLPCCIDSLSPQQSFRRFLQAIFYVGRGKRSRPYSHLSEALTVWNHWRNVSSKKVNKIIDIWSSGQGIICLHVFHNVIPAEAMTREAAMIDALGLASITNERIGDYYGVAMTWNLRQRQQLGAVLLLRAFNILISEGERQIRPLDVQQ